MDKATREYIKAERSRIAKERGNRIAHLERSHLGHENKRARRMGGMTYTCKHEGCTNEVNSNKGAAAYCPVAQDGEFTHRQQYIATTRIKDNKPPQVAKATVAVDRRKIAELHLPEHVESDEREMETYRLSGPKTDSINHPAHYGGDTTYEVIKVIEAWELDFGLGNCVKYIARAGKKNDTLEDLQKALFYLNRRVEQLANAE